MTKPVFVSLVLLLLAHPAMAQGRPESKPETKPEGANQILSLVTPEQLADIVRAKGFRAEIEQMPGLPVQLNAKTVLTGMAGVPVRLYLAGCQGEQGCAHILFRTTFDNKVGLSVADLNKWNVGRLHAHAYIDLRNNVSFAMDMALSGGVTMRAVAESMSRFETLLGQFKTFPFRPGVTPGLPVNPPKPGETRT